MARDAIRHTFGDRSALKLAQTSFQLSMASGHSLIGTSFLLLHHLAVHIPFEHMLQHFINARLFVKCIHLLLVSILP